MHAVTVVQAFTPLYSYFKYMNTYANLCKYIGDHCPLSHNNNYNYGL